MKLKHITTTLAVTLLFTTNAARAAEGQPAPVTPNATNRFTITGMHCAGCAGGLTSELKRAPGVASASVTFSNQLAVVAYDTNRVTSAKLVKVVEEAGFMAAPAPK